MGVPSFIDEYTNPFGSFQIAFKVLQAVFHFFLLKRYTVWNNVLWSILVPVLFPIFMPFLAPVMLIAFAWLRYPQFEDDLQSFEDEDLKTE